MPTGTPPPLEPGCVHVWRIDLNRSPGELESERSLLSTGELTRADRYRVDAPRRNFIAGRADLRLLLGSYLGIPAASVPLTTGPHGKPQLPVEHGRQICFNLTHSADLALVAVTSGLRIGVDLERLSPTPNAASVAELYFSPSELDAWRRLPDDQRLVGFYETWTRKEAVVKAIGSGLARPVRNIEVSIRPEEIRLLSLDGDRAEASNWTLASVDPGEDYVGAVACEAAEIHLYLLRHNL